MTRPPLRSCLYRGEVMHRRLRPVPHRFTYRVFWLLLDLDELPTLATGARLLSVARPNLLSFRPSDHGPGDGTPLLPWALARLARAGIVLAQPRIRLLTFPRLLGYAFTPLSIFCCEDGDRLAAVIYEVRNTFGERHHYVLPADGGAAQACGKSFHVSPFLGMDALYRFRLAPPGERLALSIRQEDGRGPVMIACMRGKRLPLGDGSILSCLVRDPLMTPKVTVGIHLEALRLWLKGAQHFRRPGAGRGRLFWRRLQH